QEFQPKHVRALRDTARGRHRPQDPLHAVLVPRAELSAQLLQSHQQTPAQEYLLELPGELGNGRDAATSRPDSVPWPEYVRGLRQIEVTVLPLCGAPAPRDRRAGQLQLQAFAAFSYAIKGGIMTIPRC